MGKILKTAAELAGMANPIISTVSTVVTVVETGRAIYKLFKD